MQPGLRAWADGLDPLLSKREVSMTDVQVVKVTEDEIKILGTTWNAGKFISVCVLPEFLIF